MMNVYFWGPKFVNAIHVQISDVYWINQRIDRLLKDSPAFKFKFSRFCFFTLCKIGSFLSSESLSTVATKTSWLVSVELAATKATNSTCLGRYLILPLSSSLTISTESSSGLRELNEPNRLTALLFFCAKGLLSQYSFCVGTECFKGVANDSLRE